MQALVGRRIHREPASSRTWDLVNSSQMLLPLSCWTHGGVVEASLATARLDRGLVTSAVGYTAYNLQMGIPCGRGCGPIAWADTLTIQFGLWDYVEGVVGLLPEQIHSLSSLVCETMRKGLWAYCLSRYTHYPPPQPLVSQTTPFTKSLVCETIFSL